MMNNNEPFNAVLGMRGFMFGEENKFQMLICTICNPFIYLYIHSRAPSWSQQCLSSGFPALKILSVSY